MSDAPGPAPRPASDAARDRRASLALVAGLFALEAVVFRRLFREPVSLLNGDSLIHSLPMHRLLAQLAHGAGWRFWNPDAAFGYPLYADGTGGFFHPFLVALFASFGWLTAHDLVYVASFALTGAFALGAARALGLPPLAAAIAAVATAFSPSVLWNGYNASYAHALAWSAAALFAFERWDREPGARALAGLGGAIALLLLAGYPPLAYATLVFLGVVAGVRAIAAPRTLASRALGLGAATLLGVALAALQVLPLVELTAQSTRQGAVAPLQIYPPGNFVAGLFLINDPELYRTTFPYFLAPLGTALALLGLGLAPLQRNRFAGSYVAAIAVCVSAAAGPGAWFYELFRAALPGFDKLRLLSPFLMVTVAPCAVLLASSLDAGLRNPLTRERVALCALAFAIGAALVLVAGPTRIATARYAATSVAALVVAAAAIAAGRYSGRTGIALGVVLAALVVESVALKGDYLRFYPDALLARADPLAGFLGERLREDPSARVAHLWSKPTQEQHDLLVYGHWKSFGYETVIEAVLARLVPSTNLLHDVPALGASDALPLAGVDELRTAVIAELQGRGPLGPGRRWIDRLHVRYAIADAGAKPLAPDLRVVWRDPSGAVVVLENPNAGAPWPAPAPGALPLAAQPASGGGDEVALRPELAPFGAPWFAAAIESLPFAKAERAGPIDVESPDATPLYVPIAAYPGWSAWLDGARVPIRPDNRFGMWIDAPAGRHRLELRFVPVSFYAGAVASAATLAGVAWLLVGRRRRHPADRQQ